jgi:hypothetical protein
MTNSTKTRRQVHLIEGRPWKDALISFLEPRSPYRPWLSHGVINKGDDIIVSLDTDPRTVLTSARIGDDGDIMAALATVDHGRTRGLIEDWELRFGDFDKVLRPSRLMPATARYCLGAIGEGILDGYKDRMGHGSAVAARVLLDSGGYCTGCDSRLPLDREDARDEVHIRTVAGDDTVVGPTLEPDWPATLCTPCHTAMVRIEFATFLEYRFARNGRCPRCSARRTFAKVPRILTDHDYQNLPPWQIAMGAGVTDSHWFCEQCHHEW